MNTTVVIVGAVTGTAVKLAVIWAALRVVLVVAPRFQIAAPKAPPQPKRERDAAAEAPSPPAAEADRTGPHPLADAA